MTHLLAAVLAVVGLSGCGGPARAGAGAAVHVVAGVYPLAFLAETIGGDRVAVDLLTRPGAEPHDLELTARQVIRVAKSDLVITLTGFQPALDGAVAAAAPRQVLDLTSAAGLAPLDSHDHEEAPGAAESLQPEALAHDPHFWLDPDRMAAAARAVATRLAAIDPAGAPAYAARAAALENSLTALHNDFREQLSNCASRALVTGHAAYGHLAAFTGLTPYPLTNSPDAEPSAARLAAVTTVIREEHVRTLYNEPLGSGQAMQVLASETGTHTAILDPVEGITTSSSGTDYLSVMHANLRTLVTGQGCAP